jgi:hypothetical protein
MMTTAVPMPEATIGEVFRGHARPRVELIEVAGDRRVLVDLDFGEAAALELSMVDDESPRPMPYQFVIALLDATSARVERVHVDGDAADGFRATVVLTNGTVVDARPGDALNVAALARAPISVDPALFPAAERHSR